VLLLLGQAHVYCKVSGQLDSSPPKEVHRNQFEIRTDVRITDRANPLIRLIYSGNPLACFTDESIGLGLLVVEVILWKHVIRLPIATLGHRFLRHLSPSSRA